MASKIIVTGSITGQLHSSFSKIAKLHAKNSFSFALVCGDLFADPAHASPEDEDALNSLLKGDIEIALPTYFTVGRFALPPRVVERLESNNDELTSNLFYLGKRSTTKMSEGIRIVALGGLLDSESVIGLSKDKYLPFHSEADARALHGANSADILLTTSWPSSVRTSSRVTLNGTEPSSEQCVAELCSKLKPRYHLTMSPDAFYEREPFSHPLVEPGSTPAPITRFISLASVASSTGAKSLYAFNLDPNASNPNPAPPGTTPSPFVSTSNKRHRPDENQYSRYGVDSGHSGRSSKRRNKHQPSGPEECFFCLSNPNLSTHLITSIANEAYVTTARGPLTSSTSNPHLPVPAHMLIIPLAHAPTLTTVPDPGSRDAVYNELKRYRLALQDMVAAKGKGELGAVTWELSRNRVRHFHWQFLPVKRGLIDNGLVEAGFRVEAENEKYPGFQKRDVGEGVGEGEYFRVWAWTPGTPESTGEKGSKDDVDMEDGSAEPAAKSQAETQLVLPLSPDVKFDVQFGRRVMAKLLGLDKRTDWRNCLQSEEDEKQDAEAFKAIFKQWDFSLDE